jgi:hypothetical protein
LDAAASQPELLGNLLALERLGSLALEPRVDVDTERETPLDMVVSKIEIAFQSCGGQ